LSHDADDRVTDFGSFMRKYRLDELPQFWNVLIGEMSLVGPRPERQYYINLLL
ncbi:MAG TPA: sugar transferase, partial [Saprospirales bacterium]|nr:sugar transferase [Saprospirales bacterium]